MEKGKGKGETKNIQKVISSFKHFIDYMKAFSKETQKVWGKKKKRSLLLRKI